MSITYKRTMNIKYAETKMNDYEYYGLIEALDNNGINVSNKYDASPVGRYDKVSSTVVSECIVGGKPMFTSPYQWLSSEIIRNMKENGWEDIEFNVRNEETVKSVWNEPKGTHINFMNMTTGELMKFAGKPAHDYVTGYNLQYSIPDDEKVILTFSLNNDNDGLVLNFNILWESARVKKAGTIKERMVDTLIDDIGLIQHIIEDTIKVWFQGESESSIVTFLEEPEIECYFEHVTESRSECSPDIVAQTREARLRHGEDNE